MIFHDPDFLVPPQALRAVRDVRVRSAGPESDTTIPSVSAAGVSSVTHKAKLVWHIKYQNQFVLFDL